MFARSEWIQWQESKDDKNEVPINFNMTLPKVLKHHTFNSQTERFNQTLVCYACGDDFPSMNKMKDHLVKHTGLRPFKCGRCPMTFTQRRTRKVHEKLQNCAVLKNKAYCVFKIEHHSQKSNSKRAQVKVLMKQ